MNVSERVTEQKYAQLTLVTILSLLDAVQEIDQPTNIHLTLPNRRKTRPSRGKPVHRGTRFVQTMPKENGQL